mmetsp:Transcript_45627/g.90515  ORF Transcript_45627/g.90515 Transcript_45627/m.90515 type:complete len:203 (-) Transcript_45627:135-743(-)
MVFSFQFSINPSLPFLFCCPFPLRFLLLSLQLLQSLLILSQKTGNWLPSLCCCFLHFRLSSSSSFMFSGFAALSILCFRVGHLRAKTRSNLFVEPLLGSVKLFQQLLHLLYHFCPIRCKAIKLGSFVYQHPKRVAVRSTRIQGLLCNFKRVLSSTRELFTQLRLQSLQFSTGLALPAHFFCGWGKFIQLLFCFDEVGSCLIR